MPAFASVLALGMAWVQAPPTIVGMHQATLPEAIYTPLEQLEKTQDWLAVAQYIESLKPAHQDMVFATYLKALDRSHLHEKMLKAATEKIAHMDGPKGPRLSVARIAQAQALSKLNRHREAAEAHLALGGLGFIQGDANALAEAQMAGDWSALLSTCEAILGRRPGEPEAAAIKGEALAKLGRFAEAEPFLRATTLAQPQRAVAWADLAACVHQRGAIEEAYDLASKGVALDPTLIEARYNRLRAALALKKFPEAREDLVAALALKPVEPLASTLQNLLESTDKYLEGQARRAANPKASPRRK